MVNVLFTWSGSGVGRKGWAIVKGGVAAVSYCLRHVCESQKRTIDTVRKGAQVFHAEFTQALILASPITENAGLAYSLSNYASRRSLSASPKQIAVPIFTHRFPLDMATLTAGSIDVDKPGKYPIVLSDALLGKSSKEVFTGIRCMLSLHGIYE
jgi:hypothetical protein